MAVGKNTIASEELAGFVSEIERVRAIKKQAGQDESAIMADAKAKGFHPGAIRFVLKVRQEKPSDRQEREALQDLYLHAIGLDTEPPLFRFAGLAAIDISARDQVIARMKEFVPSYGAGHIDVKFGTDTIRLTREKDGSVSEQEVTELPDREERSSRESSVPPVAKEPPPDVDEAGAELLGRDYARADRPVIDNPFPFKDPRRARFDRGWRDEAGSDGMGPQDPKR